MLVRIGTRGSKLALAQAAQIRRKLKTFFPKIRFEFSIVKTEGDEYQSVELFKKNHVGVFTNAIERKLLQKEVDIAVHSLKDLPTELSKGLKLAAIPKRAPIEDALISRFRYTLTNLPKNAKVGTGSPRRKRQLLRLRPDLEVLDLRGNLDTRVSKVIKEKKLDAVVVAMAGLERLGKFKKYSRRVPANQILPAIGQGALGIQIRAKDPVIEKIAHRLNHAETETLALAERAFLKKLRGGCRIPAGIFSVKKGKNIYLKAAVFSVKNNSFVEAEVTGPITKSILIAENLARTLLKKGAKKLLIEARSGSG